jgi:hypothetical protein
MSRVQPNRIKFSNKLPTGVSKLKALFGIEYPIGSRNQVWKSRRVDVAITPKLLYLVFSVVRQVVDREGKVESLEMEFGKWDSRSPHGGGEMPGDKFSSKKSVLSRQFCHSCNLAML